MKKYIVGKTGNRNSDVLLTGLGLNRLSGNSKYMIYNLGCDEDEQ